MEPIGFIGLGIMGRPMALRLIRAGTPLVVWSRTPAHREPACSAGAERAATPDEVFRRCRTVILMLATELAVDEVLGRGTDRFDALLAGHTVIHMGTTPADYAVGLAADVVRAGGSYVEAPVSGSTVPAENGELVIMISGPSAEVAAATELLRPLYREVFPCGRQPGRALSMKLAVNLYLVTTVAALAEAAHFAERQGLDLRVFTSIIDAGQLASPVARVKGAKLRERDFSPQAAIHDVRKNSRFVLEAARDAGTATPLVAVADQLYLETLQRGDGALDMAAVVRAIEARTAANPPR